MNNLVQLQKIPFSLNKLIEKSVNGNFNMLYAVDDFYIAENLTYQPWLAVMGMIPNYLTEEKLKDLLLPYIVDVY